VLLDDYAAFATSDAIDDIAEVLANFRGGHDFRIAGFGLWHRDLLNVNRRILYDIVQNGIWQLQPPELPVHSRAPSCVWLGYVTQPVTPDIQKPESIVITNEVRQNMPLTGEYEPSTSDWARKQMELFEGSGGTKGATLRGMPIIVMTSVGAKSGKLRKTPLMRVEHNGEYAVVASLGGSPKHPVWYYNLKKNPHVELQDGPVKRDYLAREVTGDEKAAWWERSVTAYPDYANYQKKTTREIPVFVLTAMGSD
jgi:F420H(2)-dependent quinone reductase